MDNGFIFDHNRCVDCKACVAACILENGWPVSPRTIFTFNRGRVPYLPLINLSLACNHCEVPVCLEGCPSGAIYRHSGTGAVVVNELKCLGCKYCQWNCPYDAPKYDQKSKIIVKCHFCYNGLEEGRNPACTSACPTGALSFGEIDESTTPDVKPWIPDKKLNPSLKLTGKNHGITPSVIPGKMIESRPEQMKPVNSNMKGIWILVLFTYIVTLSVSVTMTSMYEGIYPAPVLFCGSIILAGLISLLHLGHIWRAWSAVLNIRRSPLSREIAAFIVYSVMACLAVILRIPYLLLFASVSGLALLISIDAVYYFADRRKRIIFHGGQTFLSTLLIVSFLTQSVLPFIFIALIKLLSVLVRMTSSPMNYENFGLRFLRFAILLITGVMLVSGRYEISNIIILIFLAGELLDRILFYIDFEPVNINEYINTNEIIFSNENKRD